MVTFADFLFRIITRWHTAVAVKRRKRRGKQPCECGSWRSSLFLCHECTQLPWLNEMYIAVIYSGNSANCTSTEPVHDVFSYTPEADQCEMLRYYQTLPIEAHREAIKSRQGYNPISKSSRTAFKSTGPVQVKKATPCLHN